jgi:dihydrolipoamide dehydrogenase
VGCIPTKALLRSAEVYETMLNAQDFGIQLEGVIRVDWPAMQKRKAAAVRRLTTGVASLLKRAQVDVYPGQARFVTAHALEVQSGDGVQRVEAENVIIATGSRPVALPLPGFDLDGVLDSTAALSLDSVPDRLLIVGGGVIGAEFAVLYASLGTQVTVVEMLDRLLPMLDADISAELLRLFRKRKIEVFVSSKASRIQQAGDALSVTVETPEGEESFSADKVLVSVGRRANVEALGLEAVGVATKRNGIVVNEHMETSVPGVYAVGDVTGAWWLAHVASKEGVVAAENACGHPARMDYTTVPSCVFTHPEIASVGLTEAQAQERGYDIIVGRFPFIANGKAVTYGEREGWVKVVSERRYGQLLGVHIVGPHASDLILEGALALGMEATLDELEATIHAHPTLGESIAEAALDAQGLALHI